MGAARKMGMALGLALLAWLAWEIWTRVVCDVGFYLLAGVVLSLACLAFALLIILAALARGSC